jgi:predicted DNA-binding transcriptional regulator YafY
LLDLTQALRRRRRPVTATRLADELGVSLRTIYRDIATLIAQGAPIEGEAGLGYVLNSGFFLPPLMFGEDEVDALILGLRLVAERGDPALERAADDALAKIIAVLPEELENLAATSGMLAGPGTAPARPHLAVIRQAMRAEQSLRLRYTDKKGAATERTVWPVALGFFEAAEMLAAWCETRRDFRHFRLDRIASAEATGKRYPKRRRLLLAEWRLQEGIDPLS